MVKFMRSLKNHISLIIPLFAILFAVEFYFVIDAIIKDYESRLNRDYSIVVVANKELSLQEIKVREPDIAQLQELNSTLVIERLKKSGVKVDFNELKNFLPKFYKVYLSSFPSSQKLAALRNKLLEIEGVKRVEAFTKVHEKIYRFLLFLKNISKLFLAIIFVTSVMLVFKQIEIWNLEHSERMYIMALFGAPLWMRNAILIKLSVIDTIISTLLVYLLYSYVVGSGYLTKLLSVESIGFTSSDLFKDALWLFGLGLIISVFNVIIVSMRRPKAA